MMKNYESVVAWLHEYEGNDLRATLGSNAVNVAARVRIKGFHIEQNSVSCKAVGNEFDGDSLMICPMKITSVYYDDMSGCMIIDYDTGEHITIAVSA